MKRWTRKLLAGLLSFGMLLQAASPLSALAADGNTQSGALTIWWSNELLATANPEADGTLNWEMAIIHLKVFKSSMMLQARLTNSRAC